MAFEEIGYNKAVIFMMINFTRSLVFAIGIINADNVQMLLTFFMYVNFGFTIYTMEQMPYGRKVRVKETLNCCFLVVMNYH